MTARTWKAYLQRSTGPVCPCGHPTTVRVITGALDLVDRCRSCAVRMWKIAPVRVGLDNVTTRTVAGVPLELVDERAGQAPASRPGVAVDERVAA